MTCGWKTLKLIKQCPEASNALKCASGTLLAAKFVFWKDKCIKWSSDCSSTCIISAQTGIALHITLRLQIHTWICSASVLKQLLSTDQNTNTVQMTLMLIYFALSQAFASQNTQVLKGHKSRWNQSPDCPGICTPFHTSNRFPPLRPTGMLQGFTSLLIQSSCKWD